VRSQGASSQSINSTNSSEAPAARPGAPLVNGVSKAASVAATKADNVENAPEGVDENAPPQKSVSDPQVSASRDSLSQTPDEGEGITSAIAKRQDEAARPKGTVSVSPSAYPSIRVPPELQGQSAVTAESLQIGEAVSRTAPRYPEEAASQGVEGTVKLRAIVGKDGAVENVTVISGPPLLASAAVATVRQWRYKPTLLGDQPVEVAEDISIVFQLANARDPEN
jgi:protein TonB